MLFQKPFLSIKEQIFLLKQRGLFIGNEIEASYYLKNISYYHFAIYAKTFQVNDAFIAGTGFKNIINIYEFDKKLRFLFLDILERIEMSIKCTLISEIKVSSQDVFWYSQASYFSLSTEKNQEIWQDLLKTVQESKEGYIQHFYEKYHQSSFPPAWMCFEALSFGECIKLSALLNIGNKQKIAKTYSLPEETMIKWLKNLSAIRNICAHHARLWNRKFTFKVKVMQKYSYAFGNAPQDSLWGYVIIMQIFMQKINSNSSWINRLESLILEYKIDPTIMGFPSHWKCLLESLK